MNMFTAEELAQGLTVKCPHCEQPIDGDCVSITTGETTPFGMHHDRANPTHCVVCLNTSGKRVSATREDQTYFFCAKHTIEEFYAVRELVWKGKGSA